MSTKLPGKHDGERASKRENMTPFHFGPNDRLFGLYEPPPPSSAREVGIVIAYPVGHEYGRSHKGCRQLARQLSLAGFPVLRFDYFGSGDSLGEEEEGSLDLWVEDLNTAIGHMERRCRRVSVVGLRLGASLAAQLGEANGRLDTLVLWQPVVDGARYLDDLRAQQLQHETKHGWQEQESRRLAGSEGGLEVLGFLFSDKVVRQIEQLDLDRIGKAPAKRLLIVDNRGGGEYQPLRSRLEQLGCRVDEAEITEPMMWYSEPYEMVLPTQSIQRIVHWLSEAHHA